MSKVHTDKTLIDQFLTRGVENIYPTEDALRKKLMSGDRIKTYQGFDPTGPYLHIGHAMGIRALRILQKLGHEVIFLVGDFTSRVGDPDKDKARKMLTTKEIEENMKGWKEQAGHLIDFEGDNPVKFMHNYDWLSKLNLEDLIELMSKSTVQQMIERDMFQRRLNQNDPIGLQEFIYPLMQGYDSVAMEVDLEIGGTDQIFNMLVGRSLCKSYLNKEKYVRANILMEAPDALTMSKTKGNGINLSDSAEDMYGKAMSYPDELIVKGLTLLTEVPMEVISQIEMDVSSNQNQMKHKKFMAYEIVKSILGEAKAKEAQLHFEKTVQNKEADEDNAVEISVEGPQSLFETLKNNLNNVSNSEIRRTIEQGGVSINGEKLENINASVDLKSGDIIKFGKRTFFKIK